MFLESAFSLATQLVIFVNRCMQFSNSGSTLISKVMPLVAIDGFCVRLSGSFCNPIENNYLSVVSLGFIKYLGDMNFEDRG